MLCLATPCRVDVSFHTVLRLWWQSTSALEVRLEAKIMRMCLHAGITCISVGHRPTLMPFHSHVLKFDGRGGVERLSAQEAFPAGVVDVDKVGKLATEYKRPRRQAQPVPAALASQGTGRPSTDEWDFGEDDEDSDGEEHTVSRRPMEVSPGGDADAGQATNAFGLPKKAETRQSLRLNRVRAGVGRCHVAARS